MGEWVNNHYLGSQLNCIRCSRNFVKQTFQGVYAKVACICSWCGCEWKINCIVRDSYLEEDQPSGFRYQNEGD